MTSKDLTKRIITSIPLILLITLSFNYIYILIITLLIVILISWIEFNGLISKISKFNFNILFINLFSLIYLIIFSFFVGFGILQDNFKLNMLYLILTCILSDVGGLILGKTFKGKKLTKISPNKTISGSIGSFIFSLIPLLIIWYYYKQTNDSNFYTRNFSSLIPVSLFLSLICQLGDLFISYFKRMAKVNDTGSILPGHGGLLDRIDGVIFVIPAAYIIDKIFF